MTGPVVAAVIGEVLAEWRRTGYLPHAAVMCRDEHTPTTPAARHDRP